MFVAEQAAEFAVVLQSAGARSVEEVAQFGARIHQLIALITHMSHIGGERASLQYPAADSSLTVRQ